MDYEGKGKKRFLVYEIDPDFYYVWILSTVAGTLESTSTLKDS